MMESAKRKASDSERGLMIMMASLLGAILLTTGAVALGACTVVVTL